MVSSDCRDEDGGTCLAIATVITSRLTVLLTMRARGRYVRKRMSATMYNRLEAIRETVVAALTERY